MLSKFANITTFQVPKMRVKHTVVIKQWCIDKRLLVSISWCYTVFNSLTNLDYLSELCSNEQHDPIIILGLLNLHKYFNNFFLRLGGRTLASSFLHLYTNSLKLSVHFCFIFNKEYWSRTISTLWVNRSIKSLARAFQLGHCLVSWDVNHSRASPFKLRLNSHICKVPFITTHTSWSQ